jgi:hypothetical protein
MSFGLVTTRKCNFYTMCIEVGVPIPLLYKKGGGMQRCIEMIYTIDGFTHRCENYAQPMGVRCSWHSGDISHQRTCQYQYRSPGGSILSLRCVVLVDNGQTICRVHRHSLGSEPKKPSVRLVERQKRGITIT